MLSIAACPAGGCTVPEMQLTREEQEGLGQAVRELRTKSGLTQEQLGRDAKYKSGAGVSISRLEGGLIKPDPARLHQIADALGVSLQELLRLAAEYGRTPSPDSAVATQQRIEAVQQELDRRKESIAELTQEFGDAHERAKSAFLIPLLEVAERINGGDPAPPSAAELPKAEEAAVEAASAIEFTRFGVAKALAALADADAGVAALGSAAAYPSFAATVAGAAAAGAGSSAALTAASTRGLLRSLQVGSSPLQRKASAGAAAIALSSGVAVGVVAALFAQQRNRKQQQKELVAALDRAEAELAENQPNVDHMCELLPEAARILDYVSVHAAHALARWTAQIGEGPELADPERERYEDFVSIAAAQLAVSSLGFDDLVAARGEELDQLTAVARATLSQAKDIIESRV